MGRALPIRWMALVAMLVAMVLLGSRQHLHATAHDAVPPDHVQRPPATDCVSDALLENVRHYYEINKHRSPGFGTNWKRVLIAFGDVQDSQLTPMSAADARTRESRWLGWQPVRKALDCIEAKSVQPTPQAKQTQQPGVTSKISVTAGPDVVEGDILTFSVTAAPAPTAPLNVDVTVTATGSYAVPATTYTATIPTSGSWTMKLSSYADSIDEPNGTVTATIDPGSGYTISSTAGSATLTVQDDDDPPLPQVGISSGHMSIVEGDDVTLTITSTPAPPSPLTVPLSILAAGDFGVTSGSQTVTIPTSGSVTRTISTTNDDTPENDGSLAITVGTGTGYDVSLNDSFRYIQIADNDFTFAALQSPQSAQPTQVSGPSISIDTSVPARAEANAKRVIPEGNAFTVTVTADTAPSSDLTVKVRMTQHGGHITSPSGGWNPNNISITSCSFNGTADRFEYDLEVTIPGGATTGTLNVRTKANLLNTPRSTFKFSLVENGSYMVSEHNNVKVSINTIPLKGNNVGRVPLSWVKGWRQSTFGAALPRSWDRVRLAYGDPTMTKVYNPPLKPMTSAEATAIQSRYPKLDPGNLVMGVMDWLNWGRTAETLREIEACAELSMVDPSINVETDQNVHEGTPASFTITAIPAPKNDLIVPITVTATPINVITGSVPTNVTISAATGIGTLSVPTSNNMMNGGGTVTVMLDTPTDPSTYTLGNANTATVTLFDPGTTITGGTPHLSVTAGSSPIAEGGDAVFTITAAPAITETISVIYVISSSKALISQLKVERSGASAFATIPIGARSETRDRGGIFLTPGSELTITVTTRDDATIDGDGTVKLTLQAGVGAKIVGDGSASVTVTEND